MIAKITLHIGWETILWNEDNIVKQYNELYDAEDVVDLHLKVRIAYENGIDIRKDCFYAD